MQESFLNHTIFTDQPEWGRTPCTLYPSHLRQCSYSSQSHFQTLGLSGGGKKNSKYMKGTVPKQMNKCVCQTLWRWPFCLSIRVAYFYLLLWAFLLLNYSSVFFSHNGTERKPFISSLYSWNLDDTECVPVCTSGNLCVYTVVFLHYFGV